MRVTRWLSGGLGPQGGAVGFGPAWCAAPAERLRVRSGRRPWGMRRLCRDEVPSTETPSRRAGRKRRFSEQGTWDEGAAAGEQWPPGSRGRTPSSSRPPPPEPVCADASCERSRAAPVPCARGISPRAASARLAPSRADATVRWPRGPLPPLRC